MEKGQSEGGEGRGSLMSRQEKKILKRRRSYSIFILVYHTLETFD